MADIIEIKSGELLNLRKLLLKNEFTAKSKKRNISLQWHEIDWLQNLFTCDLVRESLQLNYARQLTMKWFLKINNQKEITFSIEFEDYFLATLGNISIYNDQLIKIVGLALSDPPLNLQASTSVIFFPEDIQFIRHGTPLKTMSNKYGFLTFDAPTQTTNWELNISGSLPVAPPVAAAPLSLPPVSMLAPTIHSTSVTMSAAPNPMIRQPGPGASGPPANSFLSGIQENLARGPPTALSSQFNFPPNTNLPPPTTLTTFAASTPRNKYPSKKKVIWPASLQSSSSDTSYRNSEIKTNKSNKKKGKSKASHIYESLNSFSEDSQRNTIVCTSSPVTLPTTVTTSPPVPATASAPTRPPLLLATGEPMNPDLATFIAAAVQTMNVGPTCMSDQQLQEHADIHGTLLMEMYENLKLRGRELNEHTNEEDRNQTEHDQQSDISVGAYDEMGTHSPKDVAQHGPVTRSKSVAPDNDGAF